LLKNRLGPKGITLEIEYNPGLSDFKELNVVNRLTLLDKSEKEAALKSITSVQEKLKNNGYKKNG
jgi:hypothetical protein